MPAPPALTDSLVDYAGLFPPAKLAMADAVRNHASYLRGPHSERLGRFVLPLDRLSEFEAAYLLLPLGDRAGWNLSVVTGNGPAADGATFAAHNRRHPSALIVAAECKATTPAEVPLVCAGLPANLEVWIELSSRENPVPSLQAIKAVNRHAKIRTGGVTPEAFPSAADVARFLTACRDTGVICKATAGLHHPLRGDYALTYEPGGPRGAMFGFLNVFLAATLLHTGGTTAEAEDLLMESAAESFRASPEAIHWRNHVFSSAQIAAARRSLCRSFGSCSFTEPMDGLRSLGWM